jgi:hypothetical protein
MRTICTGIFRCPLDNSASGESFLRSAASCHPLFTFVWDRVAMEPRGEVLGPASTRFNDYIGTVAADDAEVIMDRPSLYELARIDRDHYTIVGIDLNVDGPATATVYAIDRVAQEVVRPAEIIELGRSRGEVPVVPFDIPEPNVEEFIRHAFRRISVRLVTHDLGDQVLVVMEPHQAEDPKA